MTIIICLDSEIPQSQPHHLLSDLKNTPSPLVRAGKLFDIYECGGGQDQSRNHETSAVKIKNTTWGCWWKWKWRSRWRSRWKWKWKWKSISVVVDLAGHESHPVQHKRKKKEIGNTRKYYQHVVLLWVTTREHVVISVEQTSAVNKAATQ